VEEQEFYLAPLKTRNSKEYNELQRGFCLENTQNKKRNCPIKFWSYLAQNFQQAAQIKFDISYKMDYPISNTQNLTLIGTERTNNPISKWVPVSKTQHKFNGGISTLIKRSQYNLFNIKKAMCMSDFFFKSVRASWE